MTNSKTNRATLAKKITLGSINGVRGGFKMGQFFDEKTKGKLVMRIVGIARSADLKASENMGDSFKFNGEFKAWNAEGEQFISPVCYLPEPAQGMLHEAISSASEGVEFALDIFLSYNETAIKLYEFAVVPLVEVRQSTALESFASAVTDAVPLLESKGPDLFDGETLNPEAETPTPPTKGKDKA